MVNIPTLRLHYVNGLLRRLARLGAGTSAELVALDDVSSLFAGPGPHQNPDRRASDCLRHARLFGLTVQDHSAWQLTPLGERYVEAANPDETFAITPGQRKLLAEYLHERAADGDEFATSLALAASLWTSVKHEAEYRDLAVGLAKINGYTAWQEPRTFESQGARYFEAMNDAGLIDGHNLTSHGELLLSFAEVPDHPPLDELVDTRVRRVWWVNQNKTWAAERAEGILWAPLLNKAGGTFSHWTSMADVAAGDVILHYRGGSIVATSTARGPAVEARRPASLGDDLWEAEGRLVESEYNDLADPIGLSDIPESWRIEERGPFNVNGGVNQGYLFPLSPRFVARLSQRYPELDLPYDRGQVTPSAAERDLGAVHSAFRAALEVSGLAIAADSRDHVGPFLASIVTKPFVILSGMSGSGKTQLALKLGEWFGGEQALVVAVRPDWTGPEALLGYEDALQPQVEGRAAWFAPDTLRFLLRAHADPDRPYLLLLDEMNLAHVERYFSDFLSGLESRKPVLPHLSQGADGKWREAGPRVPIPRNVVVVGTVNVDETTYLFSPKVLDRACTFEIRTATDELDASLGRPKELQPADPELLSALLKAITDDDAHINTPANAAGKIAARLTALHEALSESGDEFGHRVFGEALRLTWALEAVGISDANRTLDQILLLKILPKLHGSRRRIEPVLQRLLGFAIDPAATPIQPPDDPDTPATLPRTAHKLRRMLQTVATNQFVSFSE